MMITSPPINYDELSTLEMGEHIIKGGCLCGACRYQFLKPEPDKTGHCHCTQCRKITGAIVFTATTVCINNFKWDTPDGLKSYPMSPSAYKTFESSPGITRGFCKECGGSLTWYDTKRSDLEILVGCVDDIKGAGFQITSSSFAENAIPGWEVGPKDIKERSE